MQTNFKEVHTLYRHMDLVNTVKFSPNGRILVTASRDGCIHVWDTQDFSLLQDIIWHKNIVNDMAWSPDSSMLATVDNNRNLELWGFPSGKHLKTVSKDVDNFVAVCFDLTGGYLAGGTLNGGVYIWSISSLHSSQIWTFSNFVGRITSIDFRDFTTLFTSSMEGVSSIWAASSDNERRDFTSGHTPITYGEISPSGDTVLVTALNSTISLYNSGDNGIIRTYLGHRNFIHLLAARFFYRGERELILCGSEDHKVYIWDAQSGEIVQKLKGHTSVVVSAACHPSEDIIASYSYDSNVILWRNEEEQ